MTSWFRRGQEPPPPPPEPEDSPAKLLAALFDLTRFINQNAGRLPVEAVVVARRITDTVREVIDTSAERELDVHAVIAVKGILSDYLPTTLRSYLALDPETTSTPRADGHAPADLLIEQIYSLWAPAADVLAAIRSRDVDALASQGNFLRTKFSRSDLDL
jgi:hypothetical protein